jgi:predicted nucleic acid-binding protein
MKYVLDSSVAFKWVVPETHSDKTLRLREDFRKAIHELLSPDVFPIEIGHALTRPERQGRVSPANGWALWLAVMADAPRLHPSLPLLPRAYELSSLLRVGIYDCLYVALAEREKCDLVTADDKLIKNLQKHFPFLRELASFPS